MSAKPAAWFARCAGSVLLAVCATPAVADGPFHVPVYTGTPLMIAAGVVAQQNLAAALRSGKPGSASAQPTAGPQWLVVGTTPADMPRRMASQLAPAVRADAQRAYQAMLDRHPALMKRLGVRADDVACGLATFLAGAYIAFHDVDFPDRQFAPLYEQVRRSVAANPRIADAPMTDRRETFEQMVIIGTFLAVTREQLKQSPDPAVSARLKDAAKGYLEQFMKIDPARLVLTDGGLVLR